MSASIKTDYLQEIYTLITQLSTAKQEELIAYIRNFVNDHKLPAEDEQSLADALAFPKPEIEIEDVEFERLNIQLRNCDLGESVSTADIVEIEK